MKKNFFKNWLSGKSHGEALLEVIVALLVITMGAATATSLIITAINANVFNKDSLIALNLAQEGLEYMRNLRDSNWMAYSADTQRCWNMATSVGACASDSLIAEAYQSNLGEKKGFSLGTSLSVPKEQALDLNGGVTGDETDYLINYYDLDTDVDSDDVGGTNDDKDIMGSGIARSKIALVSPTKYYRSIEVQYKTITPITPWDPTPVGTEPAAQYADMMIVTSRVQWLDGTHAREVSLSSALSRYK